MTDKNQEKFLAETMRRGFTLVELLVVVAILGILGAIGLQGVTKHIENTRKTAAKTAVDNIRGAVTAYMIGEKKSTPPSDLKVVIEVKGKRFVVISNGPDGSPNTEDDIRSDKIEKTKDK